MIDPEYNINEPTQEELDEFLNIEHQDEIQEDTTSMEEKLEALKAIDDIQFSNCCGAWTYGEYMMCSACGEHCGTE